MNCIEFEAAIEHFEELRLSLIPPSNSSAAVVIEQSKRFESDPFSIRELGKLGSENGVLQNSVVGLELSSSVFDHAQHCPACWKVLCLHQQLDLAIAAWRGVEPPRGLVDAVMLELAQPGSVEDLTPIVGDGVLADSQDREVGTNDVVSTPQSTLISPILPRTREVNVRKRSSQLAIVSLAGCMLFAVVFTIQGVRQAPQGVSIAVQPNENTFIADKPLDVSETLTAVFSDLRLEYVELASETKSMAREMIDTIPQSLASSILPDAEDVQIRPNSSDMVRIWHPIGSGVESALGFLWQAVPSDVPSG